MLVQEKHVRGNRPTNPRHAKRHSNKKQRYLAGTKEKENYQRSIRIGIRPTPSAKSRKRNKQTNRRNAKTVGSQKEGNCMEPEKAQQLVLKQLERKRKPTATMVTPYWEKTIERPHPKAVIPYEVYKLTRCPSEHDTVRTLNDLVASGVAIKTFVNNWTWYTLKE